MVNYESKSKAELVEILQKKHRTSRPMPAIVPINKKGEVRYGTAAIEGGLVGAALIPHPSGSGSPANYVKRGLYKDAIKDFAYNLNPMKTVTGKAVLIGGLLAVFGKGRKVGPGRLS
jgi:hypothetical protein